MPDRAFDGSRWLPGSLERLLLPGRLDDPARLGALVEPLTADEFISRFLQHKMPRRMWRMRHCGLLSNRFKKERLKRYPELLAQAPPPEVLASQGMPAPPSSPPLDRPGGALALHLHLTGVDLTRCPACGEGKMLVVEELIVLSPAQRGLPRRPRLTAKPPPGADTS